MCICQHQCSHMVNYMLQFLELPQGKAFIVLTDDDGENINLTSNVVYREVF